MQKINSVDAVKRIFDLLADDYYNLVWGLVEDFECNGHIVRIKNRPTWTGVIIDDGVVDVGKHVTYIVGDKEFKGSEYAIYLLNDRK